MKFTGCLEQASEPKKPWHLRSNTLIKCWEYEEEQGSKGVLKMGEERDKPDMRNNPKCAGATSGINLIMVGAT